MYFLLAAKGLHIVGFVAWFAGLFYLVRIFVYHAEAAGKPQPERDLLTAQYTLMEWRVYRIICNPAMMITWTAGLVMLGLGLFRSDVVNYLSAEAGTPGWMHLKLLLVVLLTAYHLWCKRSIRRLEAGTSRLSDFQFRLLNEAPTLFLVAISFLAVYGNRGLLHYGYLLIGLLLFAGLLYWGARAYKRRRQRQEGAG
mgnify:CR=1 FL=1